MPPFIDIEQIRLWWNIERQGNLTELRLIDPTGMTYSGYYRNLDNIIRDICAHPECNAYATINELKDDVYSRVQHECLVKRPKTTTSDNDVRGRSMVVIDIDPVRSAGVCSTDEELGYAKQTANKVFKYLLDQGFSRPIVNLSGNGVHLRYRTRIKADADGAQLIKDFLYVISSMFSDEHADIDISVFNASRILKVVGCPTRKGADTAERPQRISRYVSIPDEWEVTEREYFAKVAALKAIPEAPSRDNNYRVDAKFDLRDFITRHNIGVEREVRTNTGTRYILKHCVFCDQHTAPDAMIFQGNDGSLGYHCFHQSCASYKWSDVRVLLEPEYHTRTARQELRQRREYYAPYTRPEPEIEAEDVAKKGKKWLAPSDVKYDAKPAPAIPTGYYMLDRKTGGLLLGAVTVVSGINSSGKSVWIDNLIMNVISRNYPVAVWSGELTSQRFFDWLYLVAAGKSHVKKIDGYDNFYRVPPQTAEHIAKWMDNKLWLYSQNYQNSWPQLLSDLRGCVQLHGIKLAIIDNMSALDISECDGTQWEKQKNFIVELNKFAKAAQIHCILVVHPRKVTTFLRKEDILGDGSITNLVDGVYIVHRTGRDFTTRASEFFKKEEVAELSKYSTVIEVAKDRNMGANDTLMGLYYEVETKRLKENPADNINYGIFDEPTPPPTPPDPDPYDDTLFEQLDEAPF